MSWWRFGQRKPSSALDILKGAEWVCSNCELPHTGMFDLAAHAPDPWRGSLDYAPNSDLALEDDFLSEDFCVLDGRNFLVRCILEIPVHGMDEKFGFGCWGSLSQPNFEYYVDHFDNGILQGSEQWSSWLSNQLYTYIGTEPVACWMFPRLNHQRPVLKIQDEAHPLAIAQRSGIEPEQVLEFFRYYGHPIVG